MARKSIMQNLENKRCYICWQPGTDVHHCMHGTANRKRADEDGLFVVLCRNCHMRLHDDGIGDLALMKEAEKTWLKYNQADISDWIQRYGKNYLEAEV